MKKKIIQVALFAGALALAGCTSVNEESAPEITAQDIASALQMQKWTIEVPKDYPPQDRIGLKAVFKDDSKIIRTLPTEPGEKITLIIWRDKESKQFNFYAICNDVSSFGDLGLKVKPGSFYSGWNNKICSVGDEIMEGHTGEKEYHIEICFAEK